MLKDGGRQPGNREERSLSASTVIARWQENGEPCKSRGLRTVLWAAGGEIPPADPAAWNPNPTDRGKRGTKYHIVVSTEGLPLGASAANVNDTTMFPELLRLALVVGVAISRLLADAGYDSADNRWLCLREGIRPVIRHKGVE